MYNGNIAVATKVALIEGKQVGDPMNAHCGDETGVMNLRSGNAVGDH